MAQKFVSFTLISCLLILSCSSYCEARPAHKGSVYYYTVRPQTLLPRPSCSDSSNEQQNEKLQKPNAKGARLSLKRENQPNVKQLFSNDKERANFINIQGKKTHTTNSIDISQSASPYSDAKGNGNFHTTLAFGTPVQNQTLIIDTGSDITWTQCQACTSCYKQREPRFDPSKSSTYSNTSCIPGSRKTYNQHYEDNTYSRGVFGCDKLTLPLYVVQKFQFGCGRDNSPGFGENAGVLGLGRGKLSLMSQAATEFNLVFCYCLPKDCLDGYLLFGHQATEHQASSSLKYTPLLQPSESTPDYYYVELVGISVADKKLNVSSSVLTSMGKRTILDSGTVITRLPSSVYAALQSAFNSSMSIYPSAPELEILDTCYNLEGQNLVSLPKVVLHFGGGTDVNLQPHGTVWTGKRLSQVCLAFAKNDNEDDYVIIGSTQQLSMLVLYDLKEGRVGFGGGAC